MENTISSEGHQDYRDEAREKFFQHSDGSTMSDILLILSMMPMVIIFLPLFFKLCLLDKLIPPVNHGLLATTALFLTEFIAGVFPVILVLTVLSDVATVWATASCLVLAALSRLWFVMKFPDLRVGYWNPAANEDRPENRQPFLTYFRAGTFLLTAISILAVDFHIYPRRFAKTESYGVSFMDTGTGFFIVSSALVRRREPIASLAKESAIFLCLGALRYLSTRGLDYQTFDTEYGRHWNFFITLGLVRPIARGVQKLSGGRHLLSGLVLMCFNQFFISTRLENYVMSDRRREGWLEANREGLVSLTGFVCIHLLACSVADLVRSVWRPKRRLQALCVLWAVSLAITLSAYLYDRKITRVSRRLANLPYVLWMIGLTSAVLSSCVSTQVILTQLLPVFCSKSKCLMSANIVPELLESANRNGLLFFLISNLFTGLLNVCFDLYGMGNVRSMFLLGLYMLASCAIVYRPFIELVKRLLRNLSSYVTFLLLWYELTHPIK